MADSRAIRREVGPSRRVEFDEQLWPITCAILILAGFVAGIVYATSKFDDPRILYNGWVRLASVGLMVLLLFGGVLWLQGKMLRRLQLCILLSLLLHFGLAIYLHQTYLAMSSVSESRRRQAIEVQQRVIVPEYHWQQIEQPEVRQSFESVVETETPQAAERSESAPAPQESAREVPPAEKVKMKVEEPTTQQPNPAEVRRAQWSAPRRAEQAAGGQISRQSWKQRPEPGEPIPEPIIQPAGNRPGETIQAQASLVERQTKQPPRLQRQTFDEPTAVKKQATLALARHASQPQPLADVPTTPTPTRQMVRPTEVPRTEAAATEQIQATQPPKPITLNPAAATAARQTTALKAAKSSADPASTAAPSSQVVKANMRKPSTVQQPRVTQSPNMQPSRQLRQDRATVSTAAEPQPETIAAAVPKSAESLVQSGGKAVAKTSPAPPRVAAQKLPGRELPSMSDAAQLRQPAAHRANISQKEPAANESAPSQPATLQRAIRGASLPSSDLASEGEAALTPSAVGGAAPSAIEATSNLADVTRSDSQSPTANQMAMVGVTQRVVGSAQVVTRVGQPRSAGIGQPSLTANVPVPRPARATTKASIVAAPLAESTPLPGDGKITNDALQAKLSEQNRRAAGLPGSRQQSVASGTIASLTASGVPSSAAASRRKAAVPTQGGGPDLNPNAAATLARVNGGTSLPMAAVPVENVSGISTAGVAMLEASLPGVLETGSSTSVERTTKPGPTAAPGAVIAADAAEFGVGTAEVATQPGHVAPRSDAMPVLAGNVSGTPGGRTASAAAQPSAEAAAEPSANAIEGGPSARGPSEATLGDAVLQANRTGAGLPVATGGPVAIDGALASGPAAATPGATAGPRRLPQGNEPGPSVAAAAGSSLVRATNTPGLPRGLADTAETQPEVTAAAQPGTSLQLGSGPGVGEVGRREGGLPVQISAPAGPGGLSELPSPQVGLPSRRARPESEVVHSVSSRFHIERSGGELAVNGVVSEPVEAYQQRVGGRKKGQKGSDSEGTEIAVERGLDFFARLQFPDGHWSLHDLPPGVKLDDPALGAMQSDTAATGLVLLTYLGGGYTHLDDKHRAVVRKGVDWLVRQQKPNGDLFAGGAKYTQFYSHGIASIALCEAYGMTQDPELREPVHKAIDFIVKSQHPTRGGWRYDVRPDTGQATETDTSVTGWQLMALKSAQMAGLDVPAEAFKKVDAWLDFAQSAAGDGRYAYNPLAPDTNEQRHGRQPSLAMTAEAMLMRMYLGHKRDEGRLIEGAEYLKANLPEVGTGERPLRDCYYWYYATQAMFQMRGPYWTAWNDRLRPLLQDSQIQTGELAGSWRHDGPVRDRWGQAGGRMYVTAMHLLMLEVYYRHLPLFQELNK